MPRCCFYTQSHVEASPNDPDTKMLEEADPCSRRWIGTCREEAASCECSHLGHPPQIFPVTIHKVKSVKDNRDLETETRNLVYLEIQIILQDSAAGGRKRSCLSVKSV